MYIYMVNLFVQTYKTECLPTCHAKANIGKQVKMVKVFITHICHNFRTCMCCFSNNINIYIYVYIYIYIYIYIYL